MEILTELAKQTPALGVLVWLVVVFLRHQQSEGAAIREAIQNNTQALTQLQIQLGRSKEHV